MPPVTDLKDIRVMIPRMRRALDGPTASGSVSGSLSDDQVTAVIADAIAEVIFYSNGSWPRKLLVTERSTDYLAPIAWETDEPLTEPEQTVVTTQAALNYIYSTLDSSKTSETLKEADREWSWSVSANSMSDRIKDLRAQRDRALEVLEASDGFAAEAWVNILAARDPYTDVLIEPYIVGGGYFPSGQEFDPPLLGP